MSLINLKDGRIVLTNRYEVGYQNRQGRIMWSPETVSKEEELCTKQGIRVWRLW